MLLNKERCKEGVEGDLKMYVSALHVFIKKLFSHQFSSTVKILIALFYQVLEFKFFVKSRGLTKKNAKKQLISNLCTYA